MSNRKTHGCNYVISASCSCSLLTYTSITDSSGKGRTRWTWCVTKLEQVDGKLTTAGKSLFHIPRNLLWTCGCFTSSGFVLLLGHLVSTHTHILILISTDAPWWVHSKPHPEKQVQCANYDSRNMKLVYSMTDCLSVGLRWGSLETHKRWHIYHIKNKCLCWHVAVFKIELFSFFPS